MAKPTKNFTICRLVNSIIEDFKYDVPIRTLFISIIEQILQHSPNDLKQKMIVNELRNSWSVQLDCIKKYESFKNGLWMSETLNGVQKMNILQKINIFASVLQQNYLETNNCDLHFKDKDVVFRQQNIGKASIKCQQLHD